MFALALSAMTFTSCEDVPMPYDQPGEGGGEPVIVEPSGDGTAENPFNVAAAIEKCKEIGSTESTEKYYVKGKVAATTPSDDSYGNATFDIVDYDGGEAFKCYQVAGSDGKKLPNGFIFSKDDEVVVYGPIYNFKGNTPETAGRGVAYVVTVNGQKTDGSGGGSDTAIEITCAKAVELTNALADNATSTEVYAITGYITEVVGNVSKNQQTFWMADTKDGGKVFEAFYANLPEGVSEFKAGSKVKITGNLLKYVKDGKVTPEIKNATVVILEEGSGGGGQTGEAKGTGTLDDPFNPVAASNYASSLAADAKSDKDVYIKGVISRIATNGKFAESGTHGNATFWISEDGQQNNEFYVYRTLYLGNVAYTQGTDIQVGDEVIICGKVTNYKGNTPETVQNESYIYSLNSGGGTPESNVTKDIKDNQLILTVPGVEEGNKITVDLNTQGWESGKAVNPNTITLEDGTDIVFDKGKGNSAPAYYEGTKGVRVYAKNVITIKGKAIAKVVLNCDSYNGTSYLGNDLLYATASGTTFSIINEHTEEKGGNQLRIQTIEITYAK